MSLFSPWNSEQVFHPNREPRELTVCNDYQRVRRSSWEFGRKQLSLSMGHGKGVIGRKHLDENDGIIGTINIGILFVIRHGSDRRWCSRFGMRFLLLILVADLCLDLLVLNSCLYDRALRFHMIALSDDFRRLVDGVVEGCVLGSNYCNRFPHLGTDFLVWGKHFFFLLGVFHVGGT